MTDVRWHLRHQIHGDQPWTVQAEAMRRAEGHARYGQWLEQGLGKTALALNEFIDNDAVDVMLVIAPNSFKQDWCLAPAEWGLPFIKTGMWPKDSLPLYGDCALYAVNYESVRYHPHKRNTGLAALLELVKFRRVMLVVDESKAIGNPSSDTTRGVQYLAEYAVMVRLLNGTPMTESVMDYYGQLRTLGKLHGMTSRSFRKRYAETGGFMGRQVVGINKDRQEELARLLDSCSFRALKTDWRKDLPLQTNAAVHVEMTKKQQAHYQTMLEEFYVQLETEDLTVDLVLTQQEKLRQISSCLVKKDGVTHWLEKPEDNPKIKAVLDLAASGQTKFIVAHMYRESGELLVDVLRKKGYDPAYIRGNMKPDELQAQKNRFNTDPACRCLVGQQVATARGHTLIGEANNDRCNRLFMYENHFGLYWREQIKDRNHRGAQDQPCTIWDIISSPMDAIIVDRLTGKKDKAQMMDALVAEIRKVKK